MFCKSCGTQLPDDATFCMKCGTPQKEGVRPVEPKFETCQIMRVVVKPDSWTYEEKMKFAAEVIGPKGKYNACESPVLTHNVQYDVYQKEFGHHVDTMVNKLLHDGWEAVDSRGENWWNYRFKRRVN